MHRHFYVSYSGCSNARSRGKYECANATGPAVVGAAAADVGAGAVDPAPLPKVPDTRRSRRSRSLSRALRTCQANLALSDACKPDLTKAARHEENSQMNMRRNGTYQRSRNQSIRLALN